jgi:S1-C subfamily serine protease
MMSQHNSPDPEPSSSEPPLEPADDRSTDGTTTYRLAPRGLERPEVDLAEARLFGRPEGVSGAFHRNGTAPPTNMVTAPPPAGALVSAFGRRPGGQETLQRPPVDDTEVVEYPPVEPSPWRDPFSGAMIGPPALGERPRSDRGSTAAPGARIEIRELLFGRRLSPRATLVFLGAVLLVAAVGGVLGRLTAEGGTPLTRPDVTLTQVEPGKERDANSIASVAGRVVPSVVSIEVRQGNQSASGSGVVIDGVGYVLTNNHVIEMAAAGRDTKVETVFHDGRRAKAAVVGRDPKTDLAVLKVEAAGLVVATLGSSEQLAVGDTVIAVGSPLGLAKTVTSGIVSALHRPVPLSGDGTGEVAVIDAVQTDAAINHGNSGGPLVDSTGAVVGINTAILSSGERGGSIGLGFAIPIDQAKRIAEALIKDGKVKHSLLGVSAKSVTEGTSDGAQVQHVKQGGPAERAGIREGDVIVKIGDRRIGSSNEMHVAIAQRQIGEAVPVVVVRQGRELALRVTLQSD